MTEQEIELFPGLAHGSSMPPVVSGGSSEANPSQEPPEPLDLQRELPLFSGHVGPGEGKAWDLRKNAPKGSEPLRQHIAGGCSQVLSGETGN